jgi:hypothetical protein
LWGWAPSCPTLRTFPRSGTTSKTGRYSISEVTPDRWDPALYYDADHSAPDKTYSKIGGWVREYTWDPMKWRWPSRRASPMPWTWRNAGRLPARVKPWKTTAIPERPLNTDRTAVILGNAMAGENTIHRRCARLLSRNMPTN